MMGKQDVPQPALFYHRFNLEQRVRADHPLRVIEGTIDFDFVYDEVEHLYGAVGNESIPPPVILKLMFLVAFYNVRSERELMETLPERLDWLWFVRFDIDTPIPDHSVLSKARRRWGVTTFRKFFERVIAQCVAAGLVKGGTIYCDSSIIDANASVDSIVTAACIRLTEDEDDPFKKTTSAMGADQPGTSESTAAESTGSESAAAKSTDAAVGDPEKGEGDASGDAAVQGKRYSTTDPEAAVVAKRGTGRARARYKTHRAVNENGVITATLLTSGDVNEGHRLMDLVDQHQLNTGVLVSTTVADSQYGSSENLLACKDRGIEAHMSVRQELRRAAVEGELLPQSFFIYSPQTDTYECPNNATLHRAGKPDRWGLVPYNASVRDCRDCPAKTLCTSSSKRTVRRHVRHDEVAQMIRSASAPSARRDLVRRRWLIEGSFGRATRYGLKRARYRGLERVAMQDLIIATVQNVMVLCRNARRPRAHAVVVAIRNLARTSVNLLERAARGLAIDARNVIFQAILRTIGPTRLLQIT